MAQPDVPETGRSRPRAVPRPDADPAAAAPVTPDAAAEPSVPVRTPRGATASADFVSRAPDGALPPDAAVAPTPAGSGMPRWLVLLAGAAAATVAIAGLRSIAWLAGPVLLALVIVIALAPVQSWLRRAGVPRWLATTVLLILVWTVLLLFVGLLVASAAQLAALLPNYADEAQNLLNGVVANLNDAGLVSGRLSDLVAQIDYGQIVGIATGVLSKLTDAASTLVLLLAALVFMAIEAGGFGRRIELVGAERPHLPVAFNLFAHGTRSYLLVSTVFGAIVAVGDAIALAWLGIPAAALWGVLAFITNYVPNIGFVLGVVPPALLGLLAGGWSEFIAIIVIYSVLNFVVQTLIQPRFVGDSVGLSTTVTFVALLFWGWVLGALGALLAIPLTLLVKALLVDVDPRGHWLDVLLREEPRAPRTSRARRRQHARRAALASVRRLHLPHPARRGPHPPEGDEPAAN
jgi:AI-2 transport protein TqsA